MQTQTLKRTVFTMPPPSVSLDSPDGQLIDSCVLNSGLEKELAQKAEITLGYNLLNEHLQKRVLTREQEDKKYQENLKLATIFDELGIQPFDHQGVEQYQKKEQEAYNRKSFSVLPWYAQVCLRLDKAFSFMNSWPEFIYGLLFLASLISLICSLALVPLGRWTTVALLSPFSCFGLILVFMLLVDRQMNGLKLQEWEWKKLSFTDCQKQNVEIPHFVLNTAISIKEKMPGADLFVEGLISHERQLGDPFLCLQCAGNKYYLEVWEESKFEGRT